jgi:hypothetical protein
MAFVVIYDACVLYPAPLRDPRIQLKYPFCERRESHLHQVSIASCQSRANAS